MAVLPRFVSKQNPWVSTCFLWFRPRWRQAMALQLGTLVAILPVVTTLATTTTSGCQSTWQAKTMQPPLRLDETDAARTSLPGVILMRDMELPRRFLLANSAYFVVVNKDRLRFHVNLVHKWEKMADPAEWLAYLEDEHGNRFYPEPLESSTVRAISRTFQYRSRRDGSAGGPTQSIQVSVYKGAGDFVFYDRDIYSDSLRSLTLVMERPTYGYTYRYSWQFADDELQAQVGTRASGVRVRVAAE